MIRGNILLSVGVCEIREDCCWTAKHVGTGSPKKNTAMDEISLSTTELGHLLSRVEAKSRLYMKIGVTRLKP